MRNNFSYDTAPSIKHRRNRFDLSHRLFTSMSAGSLYPIFLKEVIPGDQFNIKTSFAMRTSVPFSRPIFDNIFIDTMYFFVPYREIWDDFEKFITGGNGDVDDWNTGISVQSVPIYSSKTQKVIEKGVLDYLGYQPGKSANNLSALPARALAKVWNDWFRDENVDKPVAFSKGNYDALPTSAEWSANNWTGKLPPVSKFHDYFTSALLKPQKGLPISFPINGTTIPVTASSVALHDVGNPVRFASTSDAANEGTIFASGTFGTSVKGVLGTADTLNSSVVPTNFTSSRFTNLEVDVNKDTLGMPYIRDVRYAFAVEYILERLALSGNRYNEYVASTFGVHTPDMRIGRSEFLSGSRTPVQVQQVAATSSNGDTNAKLAVGDLAAYSLTNGHSRTSKAFTEHGFVLGVACIRQYHTYSQGVETSLLPKQRLDFYDPALVRVGEQPIFRSELYLEDAGFPSTSSEKAKDIFGYKEAFAEYRRSQNRITGQMRSSATDSFDLFHLGDNYTNQPSLTPAFIHETRTYIDRALGISADVDQFLIDFYFDVKAIRPIPINSTTRTL